jgi:hypothetical protein
LRNAELGRFIGSSQSTTVYGVSNASWDAGRGKDGVAGIDKASITCGVWREGMAVVFWTDLSWGNSVATTKEEGTVYEGEYHGRDGRRVKCRCTTGDGRTGAVTIGDERFDLADGSLFLVSTRGTHSQVRQLQRDISKLKPDDLKQLARSDPQIIEFFESPVKAK